MIILKTVIAWDVVVDELGNPTTATPLGVFCVAMVVVFAGRGDVGEVSTYACGLVLSNGSIVSCDGHACVSCFEGTHRCLAHNQMVVLITATFHFCLAFWFLYIVS